MRAIQLDEYGPAQNLKMVEVPIPEPGEGEVLIKVEAAGIIYADSQMRKGDYVNLPAKLPIIPGREVSGTVAKVGSGVKYIKPGMRVSAYMYGGGYAEYARASVGDVVSLPDRVSFLQGLVYQFNLRVAYLCYFHWGKIQPTETVLLHAAAGGIGTLLTQIAKRRADNIVIALSSSDEKLAYCQSIGADYWINYKKSDYVEEVLRITGGKGVDISLNSTAGPTLKKDPYVIRPMGRWVIYGHAAGKGLVDPFEVMLIRSLTLSVSSVYTAFDREEFRLATDFLEHWLHTEELISVTKTFPLEEVAAAHELIDTQRSHGKIALVMR